VVPHTCHSYAFGQRVYVRRLRLGRNIQAIQLKVCKVLKDESLRQINLTAMSKNSLPFALANGLIDFIKEKYEVKQAILPLLLLRLLPWGFRM